MGMPIRGRSSIAITSTANSGTPMSQHRITTLFASAAFAALLAGGIAPAFAQSSPDDVRTLLDRVDRLQRDVTTLQRQVYQGGSSASRAAGSSAPSGGSATTLELRLQ
jgi:outer membrane murein-binding lipoprotein Lpp